MQDAVILRTAFSCFRTFDSFPLRASTPWREKDLVAGSEEASCLEYLVLAFGEETENMRQEPDSPLGARLLSIPYKIVLSL